MNACITLWPSLIVVDMAMFLSVLHMQVRLLVAKALDDWSHTADADEYIPFFYAKIDTNLKPEVSG